MPYDSLGREVNESSSDLFKSMLGPVGPKQPFSSAQEPRDQKLYEKLDSALDEFKSAFLPAIAAVQELVKKVTGNYEKVKDERKGSSSSRQSTKEGLNFLGMSRLFKDQDKKFGDNFDLMDKLAKAGLKKGSIYMHDTHNESINRRVANQNGVMIQLLVAMNKNIKAMATGSKDFAEDMVNVERRDAHGKVSSERVSHTNLLEDEREDQNNDKVKAERRLYQENFGKDNLRVKYLHARQQFALDPVTTVNHYLKPASSGIMAGQGKEGSSPMQQGMFGGLGSVVEDLGKSNMYQRNIAEVAYITEGITLEMKKQQSMYRANQATTDIAVSSGHEKLQIEDQYLKLLRSGFKTQKDTLKITRIGAHLSTALGSNFEQTVEFANDLHMSLGLSTDSVSEIARGMKQTARSSKISGDAMLAAANNAKPYLEALRNAGTLSSEAATSMIKMQAGLQKFGVGSNFQELITAMTSPTAAMNASFETQAMMAGMAGPEGMGAFMNGSMQDPKKFYAGMESFSKQIKQEIGTSLTELEGMSEDARAQFLNMRPEIDLTLKAHYGKGVGEMLGVLKAARENAKDFSERMDEINKKLVDSVTTDEEKVKLMKQQDDLLQDQRGKLATKSSGIIESSGSLQEAFAKMRADKTTSGILGDGAKGGLFGKDFDVNSLRTDAGMIEALKKTFTDSFEKTNAVLSKSADTQDDRFIMKGPGSKIDEALRSGNIKDLVKLQKQLGEAQDAADSAQMAETDPARAAAKGINSLNSEFTKYAADALMYLKIIAGANLIQGTGFATLITGLLSPFKLNMKTIENIGGVMMDKLGQGKLGNVARGAGAGIKEGLGLDKAAAKLNSAASAIGSKIKNVGGKAADVLADLGINPKGMAKAIGSDIKNFAGFVGNKTGVTQVGKGAVDIAQKIGKNPIAGITEGINRFAVAQEKVPIWGKFAKKFGAGKQVAANLPADAMGALFGGAGVGAEGISKVASKAALPLMVFITAMDGVGQALKTGARAAEIFDTASDKLSGAQKAAAENAGFLTGLLNSLTFGIFDHWIGATGSVTDGLAKFLSQFALLNAAISIIMIPLKAVYGVFWGLIAIIEEVAKGVWEGIKEVIQPINETIDWVFQQFSEVGAMIQDALQPIASLFGLDKNVDWVHTLIDGMRSIGKVIGSVLHGVGWVVGLIMKGVGLLVKVFVSAFLPVIKDVISFVGWIIKAFQLLFTFSFADLGKHILSGIIGGLVALPRLLLYAVAAGLGGLPGLVLAAVTGLGTTILSAFTSIGQSIYDSVVGIFGTIGNGIMDAMRSVPGMTWILGEKSKDAAPAPGKPAMPGAAPKIPGLAGGGLVQTPGMIYAGEAGPELVMPMDQFQSHVANVIQGADPATAALSRMMPGVMGGALTMPMLGLGDSVGAGMNSVGQGAINLGGSAAKKLSDFGKYIVDKIANRKVIEKIADISRNALAQIGDSKTLQKLGDFGRQIVDRLSSSKSLSRLSDFANSIVGRLVNPGSLKTAANAGKALAENTVNAVKKVGESKTISKLAEIGKNTVGKPLGAIAQRGGAALQVAKELGQAVAADLKGGASAFAQSGVGRGIGSVAKGGFNAVTQSGVGKGIGAFAKGGLRQAARYAGPLGIAVDAGFRLNDAYNTEQDYKAGRITAKEREMSHVKNAGGMAGGLVGASAGAWAGGAAGAALGSVVPVLGTAIGGAVGAIIGGIGGYIGGDKLGSWFASLVWEPLKSGVSMFGSFAKSTMVGMFKFLMDPIGSIKAVISGLSEVAAQAWEGIKTMATDLANGIVDLGVQAYEGLKNGIDSTGTAMGDSVGSAYGEAVYGESNVAIDKKLSELDRARAKAMVDKRVAGGEKFTPEQMEAEITKQSYKEKFGLKAYNEKYGVQAPATVTDQYTNAAATAMPNTPNNTIVAKPLTDIQTRVEQDNASSKPAFTSVASAEMTSIASLTEKQLMIMNQQLIVLQHISANLTGGTSLTGHSNAPVGSARSNTKPSNSPNYHTLAYGGYGNDASKGYVNDGVT